ncbi:MAG TPA: hypothetical protein VFR32_06650 [Gaiellaceae bacterium]|nr:hypothetical protein [Gaiellaceae bacterium]
MQRLVNTSPDIVDDACNFAWMEFIRCQPDRQRSWRSWLITVAQREAWKLHAKEASHVGAEIPDRDGLLHEATDPRDLLSVRAELRVALDSLAAVPERRRQVKALQITGLSYAEIGERLGLGYTRVNALVTEANAAIDFTKPTRPREIAYFDPQRDSGTWSAYPYTGPMFKNGPGIPVYASDGVENNAIAQGMVVYRAQIQKPGNSKRFDHLNPQTMD